VVGVPYWPVFGFLAGALTIVPAVGPILAAAPAIMLSYSDHGSTTALMAGVVLVLAEVIEGYILIPQLVGREVGLHPLAVVGAILVGTALLGILGLVLAIPLAAAAKIVWREFVLPDLQAKAAERSVQGSDAPPTAL
jgi:predicted PurR-regulated permease PerM